MVGKDLSHQTLIWRGIAIESSYYNASRSSLAISDGNEKCETVFWQLEDRCKQLTNVPCFDDGRLNNVVMSHYCDAT